MSNALFLQGINHIRVLFARTETRYTSICKYKYGRLTENLYSSSSWSAIVTIQL